MAQSGERPTAKHAYWISSHSRRDVINLVCNSELSKPCFRCQLLIAVTCNMSLKQLSSIELF